jgi:hypothetical protein
VRRARLVLAAAPRGATRGWFQERSAPGLRATWPSGTRGHPLNAVVPWEPGAIGLEEQVRSDPKGAKDLDC